MNFTQDEVTKLVEEIFNYEQIQLADIPDIDLYMDQVTTFFENKFSHFKRDAKDKILTKTMINNYAKSKILFPPTKKKYNKQHLILLVLIYHAKQVLSLGDIRSLLSPLNERIIEAQAGNLSEMDNLYSLFLQIEKSEVEDFKANFGEKFDSVVEETDSLQSENREQDSLLLIAFLLL